MALVIPVLCLLLGLAVGALRRPRPAVTHGLNWWVLNVALPALVLAEVPRIQLELRLGFLVASLWLVFGLTWILFALIAPRLGWSRARTGATILVAGLGNTAFIGYPMLQSLRGPQALEYGILADQAGTFLAFTVLGMAVAAVYAGKEVAARDLARRVLLFPGFLTLILSLAVGPWLSWPPLLQSLFVRIGGTMTPLALFSVGLQMRLKLERGHPRALAVILLWKMCAAPLLCLLLGVLLRIEHPVMTVGVLQAAMPPMVSAGILADEYQLDPQLANVAVAVGMLLGFASVPALNSLL
jgi:predicted permease